MYERYFKRVIDFVVALVSIILLSPIIIVVSVLVRVKLGSPILFKQQRPGKNSKIFTMYKFRSMTDAKDENGVLLDDSIRLTKFGRFLRSTSLDELPELFNILIGNMSLVGPRPLLVEYLDLYSEEQLKRQNVLPGLTGLAQVNGRNAISWEEKFKLDIEYVENIRFTSDVKIFFQTFASVFKREGVSQTNHVTMERFMGDAHEKK
ncbi:sugar transferase [Erysipelothrix sp. HDW6C]|nr:sugar transferase [Erysipelothrix sp. HDW6C]